MPTAAPNPVVHLELHTGDPRGASDLYAQLCGWRTHNVPVGAADRDYVAMEMGRRLGGGIVACRAQRPVWLPYVEVADIREATALARALGAKILLDAREGPTGWRTVAVTSTGGEVAFWQPKRPTP